MSEHDAWIQTYSGRAFYPLRPQTEDICLIDIAHGLSNLCRYNGQCRMFYSVAEHSMHLSHAVPSHLARWALLHDASEAYLCDIPRPIKPLLPRYQEIERNVMHAIAIRYNLIWPEPEALHEYDTRILLNEQKVLHPNPPKPWNTPGEPLEDVYIRGFDPMYARMFFLDRCEELGIRDE